MSELEQVTPATQQPDEEPEERQPRRQRLRYLRHVLWTGSGLTVLLIAAIVSLYFWASSDTFQNIVRKRLAARIEAATGGRVEIASLKWHLLKFEAQTSGIVIHGHEVPSEASYAQIDSLRVQVNVLGFWSPRVLLRDLEIVHPQLHLIVYSDGSTNQPQPRATAAANQHPLDSLFDLEAGHISVERGVLDWDNRAADLDAQNRHIPLDFAANDVSLRLAYVPSNGRNPESYHVETSAHDLRLTRGFASHLDAPPVQGYVQATIDLARNAAYLRSLRLTAYSKGSTDRVLNVSGQLDDFSRPRWRAIVKGEIDLRLMNPVFGYPNTPEGIVRVDLTAQGQAGRFRTDGTIHADGASYVDPGVNARGVDLDARVHADSERLQITQVIARLRAGGHLEGEVLLDHWIPPIPGATIIEAASPAVKHSNGAKKSKPEISTPAPAVPASVGLLTNGKVNARMNGVALDTVLDIVSLPPFQRLGLDARLNGLATANWSNGDIQTLVISTSFGLTPSAKQVAGEAPVTGALDATYTQRNGAVDLRKLEVTLPSSQILAHGHLGAYPMTSPTGIAVDFHSHDLGEFDRLLRDLGLTRSGKTGTAALPISLGGQGDFHGNWTGSLLDPHIGGNLQASNLSVEIPSVDTTVAPQTVQPRWHSNRRIAEKAGV